MKKEIKIALFISLSFLLIGILVSILKTQTKIQHEYKNGRAFNSTQSGIIEEKILTKDQNWKANIELPKYNENGEIIYYDIAEKEKINGYIEIREGNRIRNKLKDTHIRIQYLDEITKQKIEQDTILEGKVMSPYETEKKEICQYLWVRDSGNTTGLMEEDEIVITNWYRYKSKITVIHKDSQTGEILKTRNIEGLEGDLVRTFPEDMEGYILLQKPEKENYYLDKQEKQVVYYYAHKSEGVIENHIDNFTNELIKQIVHTGKEGDYYKTEPQELYEYELIESKYPKNAQGFFEKNKIEVNYYYHYRAKVIIYHRDKYTNEILKKETKQGYEGENYTTQESSFQNYELDKQTIPKNKEGILDKKDIIVNYYYIQDSAGVEINYIDKITGEKLDEEIITGKEGELYQTKAKTIEGYTLEKVPENARGTMKKEKSIVNYYYLKNSKVIVLHKDQYTNEILKKEEKIGFETAEYTTKQQIFDNYVCNTEKMPENKQGKFQRDSILVEYYYRYKSSIDVYYREDTGKLLDKQHFDGYEGDSIQIEEKQFPYYKLIQRPENENITLTKQKNVLEYFYCPLDFNIKIEQKIDHIYLDGKERTIRDVKLYKEELSRRKNTLSIKIKYRIEVKNDGEIEGTTTVVNNIPDGYNVNNEFNSDWEVQDSIAIYKIDKIKVAETKVLFLEIEKKENIGEVFHTLTSTVLAKDSDNIAGIKERTLEDNEDKTEIFISIVTGKETYIDLWLTGIILIGLFWFFGIFIKTKIDVKKNKRN